MLGTTVPTPLYALYADRMHFQVLTTTIIFATYAGGVLFALLAFGSWSDAVGRRPMLLAGVGFAIASAVVFLVADSVALLLIGRVLSGLSAGVFTGTATTAVIEAARSAGARGRPRWPRSPTSAASARARCSPDSWSSTAPQPLHLVFVVHIVMAVLAGLAVLIVPETSPRGTAWDCSGSPCPARRCRCS